MIFMMHDQKNSFGWNRLAAVLAAGLILQGSLSPVYRAAALPAPTKQKLRGYLTARIDDTTVAILDDQIHCGGARIVIHENSGERPIPASELAMGMMVEAEGVWTTHHQFAAEKLTLEAGLLEKQIHDTAYLQEEPKDSQKIKSGDPAELKADGERLLLGSKTKRSWAVPST